ncbi:PEP-CTERM protein-sorting domain-containing protein [Janthinobacterium sp. OK676]|uniref:PEP-CTERM sorting domain-containing protein n=1 Tax=unclassified Janthinobacterium TaxID=2610881 RepID=UPI00088E0C87|nr:MULTISPECIES: PEP-CTERM sorting domain-containing protein [unclassified Janthinobacterium]PJJ21094.1 putative secreted protein with PEP-CTERM sorting signal [Janthinobacterium sp. 67]SDO14826.1 PEP-CTERM protein-sorting domain-containing protein [Janthinobacterium sp. OK676]
MNLKKVVIALALACGAAHASAMTVNADYSQLGTVYQNLSGMLSNTHSTGATDVTSLFQYNTQTALNYWSNAVLLPLTTTITFKLGDLSSRSAAGTSIIDTTDANGRPLTTTIIVDNTATSLFLDTTPTDNSEFNIASVNATLGGGSVNISRFGAANTTAASGGYDFLTLILHEAEHSLGFSSGTQRFDNVINATGDMLEISSSLSGLPASFGVAVSGTHIDGIADNGFFNNTSLALPGFNAGERALLSGVDILAVCQIQGCTSSQINLDPSATVSPVPEPTSWAMMILGLATVIGFGRRRARPAPNNALMSA